MQLCRRGQWRQGRGPVSPPPPPLSPSASVSERGRLCLSVSLSLRPPPTRFRLLHVEDSVLSSFFLLPSRLTPDVPLEPSLLEYGWDMAWPPPAVTTPLAHQKRLFSSHSLRTLCAALLRVTGRDGARAAHLPRPLQTATRMTRNARILDFQTTQFEQTKTSCSNPADS